MRGIGRDLLQSIARPPAPSAGAGDGPEPVARPMALSAHPGLALGDLDLAAGCTACEACARVCPTAALAVRESSGVWQIAFNASRCVGYGVCAEACQPRVLTLRTGFDAGIFEDRVVPLFGLHKRRCPSCDRPFVDLAGSDTCPTCRGDDADFAAIFG